MISFEDFKAMFDTDLPDSSDEDHTRIVRIHKDEAPLRPLRRMSIRDSFRTSIKMTTSMDLEQLEFLPSESRESVSRRAVRVNSNAGRDSVLGSVIHTTSSANSRRPSRSSFRGSIRGSLIRTTSNANHSSTNMLRNLLDTFDSIPSKDGDDV